MQYIAYSFNNATYEILSIHLVHVGSFFLYLPKIMNQQNLHIGNINWSNLCTLTAFPIFCLVEYELSEKSKFVQ